MASDGYDVNEDLEASDPSDLSRNQRIKAIHEAREDVRKVDKETELLKMEHQIGAHEELQALRNSVEHYIMELESLIDAYEDDNVAWDEGEVGWWGRYAENEDGEQVVIGPDLGTMLLPNGEKYQFIGLRSIVEAPHPISVRVEEEIQTKYGEPETVEKREQAQIPRHILMSAYRTCNEFVFDVGLDVPLEPGSLPTDKI